jgi:hypothetical protein
MGYEYCYANYPNYAIVVTCENVEIMENWMKLYWSCYRCDDGNVSTHGCDFDAWILNYVC